MKKLQIFPAHFRRGLYCYVIVDSDMTRATSNEEDYVYKGKVDAQWELFGKRYIKLSLNRGHTLQHLMAVDHHNEVYNLKVIDIIFPRGFHEELKRLED